MRATAPFRNQWRISAPTEGWVHLAAVVMMANAVNASQASAKDLAALSDLLTPAYTAMSYDRLCTMEPRWVSSQPKGMRGTATNYAEHVKDETIYSLTQQDAVIVLKAAADKARAEARRQLRANVIISDPAIEAIQFKGWCDGYVAGFIATFIDSHDRDHESFLKQIGSAIAREP